MRLFRNILAFFALGLSTIVSLAFTFVELRPIFAGDFNLMEDPGLSIAGYLFRAFFYILMVVNAVLIAINIIKGNKLDLFGLIFNAALVTVAFVSLIFYEWYVSLAVILLNVSTLLIRIFRK